MDDHWTGHDLAQEVRHGFLDVWCHDCGKTESCFVIDAKDAGPEKMRAMRLYVWGSFLSEDCERE